MNPPQVLITGTEMFRQAPEDAAPHQHPTVWRAGSQSGTRLPPAGCAGAEALGKKRIKNRYLRIALAGLLIVLLAALFRTGDYLGAEDEYHRKCI